MMSYDLEAIKTAIDLAELAGIKRKGQNIPCPFHKDTDPSLKVDTNLQVFRCFGCGASGSAIDWFGYRLFPGSYNHKDPSPDQLREAIKAAADYAGIQDDGTRTTPKRPPPPSRLETFRKEQATRAAETAPRPSVAAMLEEKQRAAVAALESPQGANARAYWESRGFDMETARKYGAGFRKQWGGADRLTFPMTDPDGEIKQHSGRAIPPHEETYTYADRETEEVITAKVAKYQKTSAKSLGVEGKLGGYFNGQALRTEESIYIVEGFPDALALIQSGYPGAIGFIGVHLGAYRFGWFTAYPSKGKRPVYICLNDDETGRKKAQAIHEELTAQAYGRLDVQICRPPEGCNDFAEALQKGIPIVLPAPRKAPTRAVQRVSPPSATSRTPEPQATADDDSTNVDSYTVPTLSRQSRDDRAADVWESAGDFEREATGDQLRACKEIKRLMMEYADIEDDDQAREWFTDLIRPRDGHPLGNLGLLITTATGKADEAPLVRRILAIVKTEATV